MKTTIITVSDKDDLYSIQDKLTWNKSGQVLLKLDGTSATFLSRKEIALLLRYANSIGSQIGIVTEARGVRFSAQRSGIPVFKTLREAQQKGWEQGKESNFKVDEAKRQKNLALLQTYTRPRSKPLPFVLRLVVFLVAVLAVLSLVVFFIPSAKIIITTKSKEQTLTIPVQGDTALTDINLSGVLPIFTRQVTIALDDQIQCSGVMEVPVTKAQGNILVQNLTENALEIPLGTVFSSSTIDDIRFASLEAATLPAGVNQTIQIPIEALTPGIAGNVSEKSIDSVEGNLGLFITVTNVEAMAGGSNESSHTPTTQDLTQLRAQLMRKEVTQAENQFMEDQMEGELFIPGSVHILEITSESYEPEFDQPSEVLKMEQEVIVEGWFLHRSDVVQYITTIMDSQLDQGWTAAGDDLSFETSAAPRLTSTTFNWQFAASRSMEQNIPSETMRKLATGRTPDECLLAIERLGIDPEQVTIHVVPAWWPRLPFLENRVEVEIVKATDGH